MVISSKKDEAILEFVAVSKFYGSKPANDGLSFKIFPGTIHAIIGENGAGKTTAMKVLFGLEDVTSGQIMFKGRPRPWSNARGALACGVGMVHQHFMLSGRHSALDNVILGQERLSTGLRKTKIRDVGLQNFYPIDRKSARNRLEQLANSVGFKLPWDQCVDELPVGMHQQLEIMKLLYAEADIMIFDEPTAVLTPKEKDNFLDLLIKLRSEGKTIVVITHKLQEVKRVADDVTVFRRGKSVITRKNADLTIQGMADLMVGRSVSLGELPRMAIGNGRSLLTISNLTTKSRQGRLLLKDLDLSIRSGEVVGIAGVEGSGQRDLWDFICGPKDYQQAHEVVSGQYAMFDKSVLDFSRGSVRRERLAFIPADRLKEAVVSSEDLLENDILGHDHEFYSRRFPVGAWIDRMGARERLTPVLEEFDVRPPEPSCLMSALSGGNQQKFVICREFSRSPELIFCAEPTRGVDVGSIEHIHKKILSFRDAGAGVLLFSSQIEELMALADRIIVMFEGRFIQSFTRGSFEESAIGRAIGGISS